MTSAFSSPPMRCSSPGVPGIAHGRAGVSGSREYGANGSSVAVAKSIEMSGSVATSGISHGSEPFAR